MPGFKLVFVAALTILFVGGRGEISSNKCNKNSKSQARKMLNEGLMADVQRAIEDNSNLVINLVNEGHDKFRKVNKGHGLMNRLHSLPTADACSPSREVMKPHMNEFQPSMRRMDEDFFESRENNYEVNKNVQKVTSYFAELLGTGIKLLMKYLHQMLPLLKKLIDVTMPFLN